MATDIATLGIRIDSNDIPPAKSKLDDLTKSGTQAEKSTDALSRTFDALKKYIVAATAALSAFRLAQYAGDATMFAANVEQANRALSVIANTMGMTSAEALKYRDSLRDINITTNSATNATAQFIKAGFPLEKLNQLGTAAQGAAISYQMMTGESISSSQALDKMIRSLVTGNVTELHTLGINVMMRDTLRENTKATGEASMSVDGHHRKLLLLNDVLSKTEPLMHLYSASTDLAAKQISSSKRPIEEMKLALGNLFLPELTVLATSFYQTVAGGMKWVKSHNDELNTAKDIIKNIATGLTVATGILAAYTAAIGIATLATGGFSGVSAFMTATLATLTSTMTLTSGATTVYSMGVNAAGDATVIATQKAKIGLLSLKSAFGVLSSAMIGWEIGTILSDKFEVVRKAGVYMVHGLVKAWDLASEAWERFNATKNPFGDEEQQQARLNEIRARYAALEQQRQIQLQETLKDTVNAPTSTASKPYKDNADWIAAGLKAKAELEEKARKEAEAAEIESNRKVREDRDKAVTKAWNTEQDRLNTTNPLMTKYQQDSEKIWVNYQNQLGALVKSDPLYKEQVKTIDKIAVQSFERLKLEKDIADATQATSDWQEFNLDTIREETKVREAAHTAWLEWNEDDNKQRKKAYDESANGGMMNAIEEYGKAAADMGAQMKNAFSGAVKQMEDSITNSIVKMKLDFKSLFQFIQQEAVRIAIARPLTNAISGAFAPATTAGVNGATTTTAGGALAPALPYIAAAVVAVGVFSSVMDASAASSEAYRAEVRRATTELKAMADAAHGVILTDKGQSNQAQLDAKQLEIDTRIASAKQNLDKITEDWYRYHLLYGDKYSGTITRQATMQGAQTQYNDVVAAGAIEIQLLKDKQALNHNNLLLTEMELKGLKGTADYTALLTKIREAEMYSMDDSDKAIQRRIYALQDEAEATKKVTAAMSKTVDIAISAANAIRDIQGGSLSTDSPEQKYRNAMAAFTTNTDASKAGELGKAALAASQAYNASGAGYQSDYLAVMTKLQGYAGITGNTTAEKQLDVLTEIRDALKDNTDLKEQNKILLALLSTTQSVGSKVITATEATADATTATAQKASLSAAA